MIFLTISWSFYTKKKKAQQPKYKFFDLKVTTTKVMPFCSGSGTLVI